MQVKLLTHSWQRAWGAMASKGLGDTVLVFVYPHPAPRVFHTSFCPPLRILALDEQGEVSHNQVVRTGQLVRLPRTRIVVECDPHFDLPPLDRLFETVKAMRPGLAGWNENVPVDRLLLAALAQAVADMRRVNEAHRCAACPDVPRINRRCTTDVCPQVIHRKFSQHERGQLVNSAGFILDFNDGFSIPANAVRLARRLLHVEQPHLDELFAASVGSAPWKQHFPNLCLRCQKQASWRPAILPPPGSAPEAVWRYERPENAAPLCHKCAALLKWAQDEGRRIDLAWGLWGLRFEAFWRWHRAQHDGHLPGDWQRQEYPLWPRQYGGETWETGSGSLANADPCPPDGVLRGDAHRAALARGLATRANSKGQRQHSPYLVPGKVHLQLQELCQ